MGFLEVMTSFRKDAANAIPDVKTNPSRYAGGLANLHPYISGHWQVLIKTPPILLASGVDPSKIQKWFAFSAESFTPPSRTLTTAVFPGIGGVNKSFITGQTINNTFSIGFREYIGLPILKLFNAWTSIFHNQTGMSLVDPKDWKETIYKTQVHVIITDGTQVIHSDTVSEALEFNRDSVQELYSFYGVYPENNPQDIPQDISGANSIQLTVNFKFDGFPLTLQDLKNNGKDYAEEIYQDFEKTIFDKMS